jgi:2-phosphosulfolactate phosphatase
MSAPDLPPPPKHDAGDRPLYVHLHADRVAPEALTGGVVIVIDAIRASVTIAKALSEGAAAIVPVLTAEEARAKAAALKAPPRERGWGGRDSSADAPTPSPSHRKEKVLLGGERGGVLIEGFDLDNSPFSYTRERIAGSTIVFTTSNGTAGLLHARHAAKIIVGSFVNLTKVCEAVADERRPVHILACGTRSDISLDDVLVAGAMARMLLVAGRGTTSDDSWQVATHLWHIISQGGQDKIVEAMCGSRGGRNMVTLGLRRDVEFCSTIDAVPVVPMFDVASGLIQL